MIEPKKNLKILIISDGTGETATAMARAAVSQYPDKEIFFTRFKNVRTKEHMSNILKESSSRHDMIVFTIASAELRKNLFEIAHKERIRAIDLLGPLLNQLSNIFESEPDYQPGLLHAVNDNYFKKIEAVEFTMNHDDGRNLSTLEEADVILVGISRTSKTPLSIYLSLEGLKVVNIPIIYGTNIPEELKKVDQRKVFALTIDLNTLHKIRKNRLDKLGTEKSGEYAELSKVHEEIEWANSLFEQNKRWPIFNVTGKALEETASEIIRLINMRKTNRFKKSE